MILNSATLLNSLRFSTWEHKFPEFRRSNNSPELNIIFKNKPSVPSSFSFLLSPVIIRCFQHGIYNMILGIYNFLSLSSLFFLFLLLLWLDNFKWAVFRFTNSLLDQVCCWSFCWVIVFFRSRFPGFCFVVVVMVSVFLLNSQFCYMHCFPNFFY